MNYTTCYEELKNIVSQELRKRCENDEYSSDYKRECAEILLERGDITQEEFAQLTEREDDDAQPIHKRVVPKTFEDCYKNDSVSNAIWDFSRGVERAGAILLVIIILVGIAISLLDSYVVQNAAEVLSYNSEPDKAFNGGIFLTSIASWIMYAIIEYWAFEFVAKLLAGLASIVQSNRITSSVALYMAKNRK